MQAGNYSSLDAHMPDCTHTGHHSLNLSSSALVRSGRRGEPARWRLALQPLPPNTWFDNRQGGMRIER